jgi:hypothetical protein
MSDPGRNAGERLEHMLAALPQDIEPQRDLWPDIAAQIEAGRGSGTRRWMWQLAAGLVLVVCSSLLTAGLLQRREPTASQPPVQTVQEPATVRVGFGPGQTLDAEYVAARQQLADLLAQRIDTLPASARSKLESNLAEMRRAAAEINAALELQPGDPLLEELLLTTYQAELGVLANVNQLARTDAAAGNLESKRIEL